MNSVFKETYQSREWNVSNRLQAYPCLETDVYEKSSDENSPYFILKKTIEAKTNIKPLKIQTCFRKIKLKELKKSLVYKKERPHKDNSNYNIAGLIYFNSNSLIDGTKIYNSNEDFEPTVVIGSKVNRCIMYSSQQPHSAPYEQSVEERWIQPFFISTKENNET
jgi:hypothetical protein